jgi:uncharacterized protein
MRITDFHTHAFPDSLAERAMRALLAGTTDVTAWHDGRLSSLVASMDRAGIQRAVVCSIATKPEQFGKILAWSAEIRSDRIVPFPSLHPADPDPVGRVRAIADAGFIGVKLHPYYQDFDLADAVMEPVYRALSDCRLVLVCHTGFDVAFPRIRRADPARIAALLERHPQLRFVATHLGAWEDWDEVDARLIGRPICLELSYSLHILGKRRARELLGKHPQEYVLFGTDSPWQDQATALRQLRDLELGPEWEQAVLSHNAARLLGGV